MPYPELPANNDVDESIVVLSEKDAREAARLLKLLTNAIDNRPGFVAGGEKEAGREELYLRARIVLHSRRLRLQYFNRSMFGEPAWDILLVLYIAGMSEGRLSIVKIAEWIETPSTTVARWIEYLDKERLVSREPHPTDKRASLIRLSDKGRKLLDAYLSGMSWAPEESGLSPE